MCKADRSYKIQAILCGDAQCVLSIFFLFAFQISFTSAPSSRLHYWLYSSCVAIWHGWYEHTPTAWHADEEGDSYGHWSAVFMGGVMMADSAPTAWFTRFRRSPALAWGRLPLKHNSIIFYVPLYVRSPFKDKDKGILNITAVLTTALHPPLPVIKHKRQIDNTVKSLKVLLTQVDWKEKLLNSSWE